MTYEQHALRAASLEGWALALLSAIRLYWLFALGWFLLTLDPWEGAVVFFPSLVALAAVQVLSLRARRHMRKMGACLDRLCVRR